MTLFTLNETTADFHLCALCSMNSSACIHNTQPRSETAYLKLSSKNTKCPATMKLPLQQSEF